MQHVHRFALLGMQVPLAWFRFRHHEENKYTLILANPPFVGSLDYESTSGKLQRVVKTKKTELLFMALFLQLLKPGGRAAVIVPDGVLFGSSKAHKELHRTLVEDHFLEGVVSLPSGVFRPYAGVSTAILLFTKTGRGGTDFVWFYDMTANGWSLDDKRNPLLPLSKLGPNPKEALDEGEHEKNNLPDCLHRWKSWRNCARSSRRSCRGSRSWRGCCDEVLPTRFSGPGPETPAASG